MKHFKDTEHEDIVNTLVNNLPKDLFQFKTGGRR